MASAELAPSERSLRLVGRAWLLTYATAWLTTLAAVLVVELSGTQALARRILDAALAPAANPPPQLGQILALAAHNLPIAAWPLLLADLRAERRALSRRVADSLVATALIVNVTPVGAGLAAYGPRVVPYIPQLPFEWAALTLGGASWLVQRGHPLNGRERLVLLALLGFLTIAAATLETVAVPHR